jgi:DNA-binding transcriptional ArsR family regulator
VVEVKGISDFAMQKGLTSGGRSYMLIMTYTHQRETLEMPRLSEAAAAQQTIEFVISVPLDLMNAMYFTHLAGELDEIDGWPAQVRNEMEPDLLAELDFLYSFPKGQPGVMGALGDSLFAHRETWEDTSSLLRYVRGLPAGAGEREEDRGIQGLAFYQVCTPFDADEQPAAGGSPRDVLAQELEKADIDVRAALAVYDHPEELRERMIRLIERFYDRHYRHDLARRMPCLERSIAAHRSQPVGDVNELARRLTGRPKSCLEEVCLGPYDALSFAPSLDMGPYVSCASIGRTHGLFYPCEQEFIGEAPGETEEMHRLARIHKALSDEQRLRILHLLREGEMYAQEIVERTGLHQSAVSRHLAFMHAVGLVDGRRQGNMKFFSINPAMRDELSKTLDLLAPSPVAAERQAG